MAATSPDHLHPWGTKRDNTVNVAFNLKLAHWVGWNRLSVLDLGCSGGGFVQSLLDSGCLACGIEGSDLSRNLGRGAWSAVPEFLFVADITRPFTLRSGGVDPLGNPPVADPSGPWTGRPPVNSGPLAFTAVTAWEVMEHLKETDLPEFFLNIRRHLAPEGLFIASIATGPDESEGVQLHQTIRPQEWWLEQLAHEGFVVHPEWLGYFEGHFVRGPHNATSSFNIICTLAGRQVPAPPLSGPLLPLRETVIDLGAESPPTATPDEQLLLAPYQLWRKGAPKGEVVQAVHRAAEHGITSTSADILLANAHSSLGEDKQAGLLAAKALQQFEAIEKMLARLHLLHAVGLNTQGAAARAMRELERSQHPSADPFWLAFHRCSILAHLGRLPAALRAGREARRLRENHPGLERMVGKIETQISTRRFQRLNRCLHSARWGFASVLSSGLPAAWNRAVATYLGAIAPVRAAVAPFFPPGAELQATDDLPADPAALIQAALLFIRPGTRVVTLGVTDNFLRLCHRLSHAGLEAPGERMEGPRIFLVHTATAREVAGLMAGSGEESSRIVIWLAREETPADWARDLPLRAGESSRQLTFQASVASPGVSLLVIAPPRLLELVDRLPVLRPEAAAESLLAAQAWFCSVRDWTRLRQLASEVTRRWPSHPAGWKMLTEALVAESKYYHAQALRDAASSLDRASTLEGETEAVGRLRASLAEFANPGSSAFGGQLDHTRHWLLRQTGKPDFRLLAGHLRVDRDWAEGWKMLGVACAHLPDQSALALKVAEEIARLEPAGADAATFRARIAAACGAWGEAESHWAGLVKRFPGDNRYLDEMLAARQRHLTILRQNFFERYRKKDWRGALELIDQVLAKDPDWAEGYGLKTGIMDRTGATLPRIEAALLEALRAGTDSGDVLASRLRILIGRGELQAACLAFASIPAPSGNGTLARKPWTRLYVLLTKAIERECVRLADKAYWESVRQLLGATESFARNTEGFLFWSQRAAYELNESMPASCGTGAGATPRLVALEVRWLIREGLVDRAAVRARELGSGRQSAWIGETRTLLEKARFAHHAKQSAQSIATGDYVEALDQVLAGLALRPDWAEGDLIRQWAAFLVFEDAKYPSRLAKVDADLIKALPPPLGPGLACWRSLARGEAGPREFATALEFARKAPTHVHAYWTDRLAHWTLQAAQRDTLTQLAVAEIENLTQATHTVAEAWPSAEARWLAGFWQAAPALPETAAEWPAAAVALSVVLREAMARGAGQTIVAAWRRLLASREVALMDKPYADETTNRWLLRLPQELRAPGWRAGASLLRRLGWPLDRVVLLFVELAAPARQTAVLSAGLDLLPDNVDLLTVGAEQAARAGHVDEGVRRLRALRAAAPDSQETLNTEWRIYPRILAPGLLAARVTKERGHYEDARRQYREILAIWVDCTEAHFELARLLDELRSDLAAALAHYRRAQELGWDAYAIHFHRGLLHFETDRPAEALADLTQAARLRADCLVSRALVSRLVFRERDSRMAEAEKRLNSGRPGEALPVLEPLIAADDASGTVHYLYACARSWSGLNDATTLNHFELALQRGAPEFWTRYNRAFVLHALGDLGNAVADMREAVGLDPNHVGAANMLREWTKS